MDSKNERSQSLLKKLKIQPSSQTNQISPPSINSLTSDLPISNYRSLIIDVLKKDKVLIVVGATGSGKTTQIPKYIYKELKPSKTIAICQPRKVAAISLAKRVAEEINSDLGHLVGYSVRFDEVCSNNTKLKFMTDGILLREFMSSPSLSEYSCVMLDEVHERSLSTDILLGLLKELITIRDDLFLVLASATMEAQKIASYFYNAKIVNIPGNEYQVEIIHTREPQINYLESLFIVFRNTLPDIDGHSLIFLTGQEDIDITCKVLKIILEEADETKTFKVIPLYSSLSPELQNLAFEEEDGVIKIVVATNIAETSITIPHIKFVFDCGLCKLSSFNPRTRINYLSTVACSKSSARQRAGRAGRTSDGKCIRLYTKSTYENEMPDNTPPEIIRADLSSSLLSLLTIGVENINEFDFFEAPPPESLYKSYEILLQIKAVNDLGKVTSHGMLINQLPLDPLIANILVKSLNSTFALEILIIVSFIATGSKLTLKDEGLKDLSPDLVAESGDHATLLNVWMAWIVNNMSREWCKQYKLSYRQMCNVKNIFDQLQRICMKIFPSVSFAPASNYDFKEVLDVFVKEDPYHRALRRGNYYLINNSSQAIIHPLSTMASIKPKSIYFSEVFVANSTYVSLVSSLD